MNGALVYFLRAGRVTVGTDPASDIVLGGVGVGAAHAVITSEVCSSVSLSLSVSLLTVSQGSNVTFTPATPDSKSYVSGHLVTAPVNLKQGDRVIIGHSFMFRYDDPALPPAAALDWEAVMSEFATARGKYVIELACICVACVLVGYLRSSFASSLSVYLSIYLSLSLSLIASL
jgi:hypothetical protein